MERSGNGQGKGSAFSGLNRILQGGYGRVVPLATNAPAYCNWRCRSFRLSSHAEHQPPRFQRRPKKVSARRPWSLCLRVSLGHQTAAQGHQFQSRIHRQNAGCRQRTVFAQAVPRCASGFHCAGKSGPKPQVNHGQSRLQRPVSAMEASSPSQ